MFEKDDVRNDAFIIAAARSYHLDEKFPHTTGMIFLLLEGSVRAKTCPRRDGKSVEVIIEASGKDRVFVTHPDADYVINAEGTRIFAFPREHAAMLLEKLLDQHFSVSLEKGHKTLPPPAVNQEAITTMPAMPAAKKRTPVPPPSKPAIDISKKPLNERPTKLGVAPPSVPAILAAASCVIIGDPADKTDPASLKRLTPSKHPTRMGLPFPTTHVDGVLKEIPTPVRVSGDGE